MGLMDSLKQLLSPESEETHPGAGTEETWPGKNRMGSEWDLAGFHPEDEKAFFLAVQAMEAEATTAPREETRARVMEVYGIRDRNHWQRVKENMYLALIQRFGSWHEVAKQEASFRMGLIQQSVKRTPSPALGSELMPTPATSSRPS